MTRSAGLVLSFCCALSAAAAPPAATTMDAVADPVENELLVRLIRLGLTRDRSARPEDAQQFVCIRDRYPGSRRVRLRCATNGDWEALAAISMARSQGATTDRRETISFGTGAGVLNVPGDIRSFGGDVKDGVLDVSPNLLADPVGKDDGAEANLTRIRVLRAVFVVGAMPDASGTAPMDVVRFARAFSVVRGAGTDTATMANAISTNALTLESYNALVGLLERDAQFRARVNAAIDSLAQPLAF